MTMTETKQQPQTPVRSTRLVRRVERRLDKLEKILEAQMGECCARGFHTSASLGLDARLTERHTLRWVLGMPRLGFNEADIMC